MSHHGKKHYDEQSEAECKEEVPLNEEESEEKEIEAETDEVDKMTEAEAKEYLRKADAANSKLKEEIPSPKWSSCEFEIALHKESLNLY